MTDTSPEAIAALLDGVTEGPWWGDELDGVLTAQNDPYHIVAECFGSPDDVLFCAEARQLVPALAAENAALKARVAELEAEREAWQPIETAPRDEDARFLAWDGTWLSIAQYGWVEGDERTTIYVNDDDFALADLTHWRPLPDPPRARQEGEG